MSSREALSSEKDNHRLEAKILNHGSIEEVVDAEVADYKPELKEEVKSKPGSATSDTQGVQRDTLMETVVRRSGMHSPVT